MGTNLYIFSAILLALMALFSRFILPEGFLNLFIRLKPDCVLELAEGMRPAEPEEAIPEEEKKERKSSTSSSSSSSSSDDDKKKAKEEASAAAAALTAEEVVLEVVEEKKEEAEEKKEETEDKKEEAEDEGKEAAVVLPVTDEGSSSVTERVVISEKRSYTHQSSTSEGGKNPEDITGDEFSSFSSTVESSSSSFTTTTRVVTSKVITSSSTTERIILSDGTKMEALENGESEKVRQRLNV